MPTELRPHLVAQISDHEHLSQTYADTAADQSLPQSTRTYWMRMSNEQHITANTYRALLRGLVQGDIIP